MYFIYISIIIEIYLMEKLINLLNIILKKEMKKKKNNGKKGKFFLMLKIYRDIFLNYHQII